jgi:ABC-type lipoprotein release transport system permease subunit
VNFISEKSVDVDIFTDKIEYLKVGLGAASAFMVVLVVVLFYFFATLMVLDRKRSIGILRSLGATRANIISIFLVTVGIIALFSWIVAGALSFFVASTINNAVTAAIGVALGASAFNPLLLFYLLLFGAGLTFIAAVFPTFTRKSCAVSMKS